ncbi:hypothetical protein MGAST_07800 [Mycobacterium gastri 'Wayne']|nr:hypothetical protein MGAST_07800 [Mycobacterium gastri 'Wayne']
MTSRGKSHEPAYLLARSAISSVSPGPERNRRSHDNGGAEATRPSFDGL